MKNPSPLSLSGDTCDLPFLLGPACSSTLANDEAFGSPGWFSKRERGRGTSLPAGRLT